MRKVNMSVIRSWVVNKIGELIGLEDEVLVEYAMGMLENDADPVRQLQLILSNVISHATHRLLTRGRCK